MVASAWTQGLYLALTFDNEVDFFSVYGGDGGGDADRFSVTAFNSVGSQIAFADTESFNSVDPVYPVSGAEMVDYRYLSVNVEGIKTIRLTQVNWGVGWDDITFRSTPVPEPATLLLFGLGLLGLAALRKKS